MGVFKMLSSRVRVYQCPGFLQQREYVFRKLCSRVCIVFRKFRSSAAEGVFVFRKLCGRECLVTVQENVCAVQRVSQRKAFAGCCFPFIFLVF
jgi:hypothetical protein